MKHAFYITAYNDPKEASRSMAQFGPLFPEAEKFLSNQSSEEFWGEYDALCKEHGFTHLKWTNEGASAAKRKVVKHAHQNGFGIISQISEDFELTPFEDTNPSVANGRNHFVKDALKILTEEPKLAFMHWTYIRSGVHQGYFWSLTRGPSMRFRRHPKTVLPYLDGEVSLFNWPYTGKVKEVDELWEQALIFTPKDTQEVNDNKASGGEYALTQVSLGKGGCLVAHPVRHTDRAKKPEGSMS
jgi:hypothetical protein